jgi:hypothetical protein
MYKNEPATENNNNSNADRHLFGQSVDTQGVADFIDTTPDVVDLKYDIVAPQRDTQTELLATWLARPVELTGGVWASTVVPGNIPCASFNPWTTWLTNPAVKNKLSNFQLLRGTLHIKFLLNGSPHHQGFVGCKYFPYQENNLNSGYYNVQQMIQLPGVILNVSTDTSGEFVLPFYSQKNWIDLAPLGTYPNLAIEMGTNLGIIYVGPITALRHVSEPTPPSVGYSIYAWMTNVELAVPTPYGVSSEGGFTVTKSGSKPAENGVPYGPISGPATTIATIASRLVSVPYWGLYAKATEIGASAVGEIAKLFGFSKPSLLVQGINKIGVMVNHATGIGYDTANKLTLDPQQEVSINPRAIGFVEEDAMTIAHIAQKPGWISTVTWNSTDARDSILAIIPVSPNGYNVSDIDARFTRIDPTPLFWLTRAFLHWSGSLKMHFKFASTRFHRGRVQLAYIPRIDVAIPNLDLTNITWNTIVDLNEDNEVEIVLPWTQALAWASTKAFDYSVYDQPYTIMNGLVVLKVINPLESTAATSSIDVVVTLAAGDDFKVNKPYSQSIQNYFTWFRGMTTMPGYQNQYADVDWDIPLVDNIAYYSMLRPAPALSQGGFTQVESNENTDNVNFGESILSIRGLIKRYAPWLIVTTTEHDGNLFSIVLPAHPYDYRKFATAMKVDAATKPTIEFNYQTFYTYFRSGYVGVRGGTRYRCILNEVDKSTTTNRAHEPHLLSSVSLCDCAAPCLDSYFNDWSTNYIQGNGTALGVTSVDGGSEFEVPYHTPANFIHGSAMDDRYGLGSVGEYTSPNSAYVTMTLPWRAEAADWEYTGRIEVSTAGAEDASFEWFFAAPSLYWIQDGVVFGRDANAV